MKKHKVQEWRLRGSSLDIRMMFGMEVTIVLQLGDDSKVSKEVRQAIYNGVTPNHLRLLKEAVNMLISYP